MTGASAWQRARALLRRRPLATAVVVVLAAAAACVLAGVFPQEPLRRVAERELRAVFGPGARLGALRVVPGSLEVEVRDLVVDAPSFHLDLPRGRCNLAIASLLALLGGRGGPPPLRVESLELGSPRLELRAAPAGPGGSPPPIVVDRLDVSDGTLAYTDETGRRAAASGVELHGAVGRGSLEATVREATWAGGPQVAFGPAQARVGVSSNLAIGLSSFTATFARSRLEAHGPIGRPGAWAPRLDFSAGLDLADLGSLGAPGLAGVVEMTGRLDGPIGDPAFEANASAGALSLDGCRVDALRASVSRPTGGPASASWTGRLYSGQVEGGARLRGSALDGHLRATDLDISGLARDLGAELAGWSGRVSGEATWDGDLGGSVAVAAQVRARLRSEGRTAETELSLGGPLDVARRSLNLDWKLRTSARFSEKGPVTEAHLRAEGQAKGPQPSRVTAQVDGEVSLAAPAGPTTASLHGTARSGPAGTTLDVTMRGLGGTLALSADVRDGVLRRLSADGERLSLEPLGAAGRVSVKASASGPWSRLTGNADLAISAAAWHDVALGDLSLHLESARGDVQARLAAPALRLQGRARLPAGGETLSASLTLDGTPLAPFAPLARPVELRGSLTGSADLTVPVARPAAASAEAHVQRLELETTNGTVASRGPFVVRARDGRVSLQDLSLGGPGGGRLDLAGSFGTTGDEPLDLTAQGELDLQDLPKIAGLTAKGHLSTRISVSGQAHRPRATGFVEARDLTLEGPSLPPLAVSEGRLELDAEELRVPGLTVQVAQGEARVEGRLPLAAVMPAAREHADGVGPGEGAKLSVTLSGVDVAALARSVLAEEVSPVAGRLSGRLELSGGLASAREARASLRLVPEGLSVQDLVVDVSPLSLEMERGEVTLDKVTLTAQGSQLAIRGQLDLARRTVDASAKGDLRLRALSPFLPDAALSGLGQVDVTVTGSLASPAVEGSLDVREGSLRLRALPQALTGLEARLVLEGQKLRIESARATLGGGQLSLSGGASTSGATLSDVDVKMSGKDIALRYPEGLRSRLDADLALKGRSGAFTLSGDVRAQHGLYDLDVALTQSLLGSKSPPPPAPLLRSIALDLRVETVNPVLVRNNLARLDATGRLSLLGDLDRPAPVGRLELQAGGRVYLQQREFAIESGQLSYDGTWDPDVSLQAQTVLRGVDLGNLGRQDVRVEITIKGPLARPTVSFTSDPSGYSEAEIVTMIVTNRARSEALSSGAWVAGEQTALLLTGRLTRGLTSGLQSLGLDEVTIQPELLARETDPGARFTFGKHLTQDLRLVYSLSLNDPENRFVELDFDPWRDVSLLGQRRDDGSVTVGGGQRVRFFGPSRRPAYHEPKVRLQQVEVEVRGGVEEAEVRELLRTKAGGQVTEWDLQDDAERVRKGLRGRGFIEAEASAQIRDDTAVFQVSAGPRFDWRVEGMEDPPELGDVVKDSLFEEDALTRGRERLLRALHERGYLEATVSTKVEEEEGLRRLVFIVAPGERMRVRAITFPGARQVNADRLLQAAGGAAGFLADPGAARSSIQDLYRDRHFLAASVSAPRIAREGTELTVTVPVKEGAPARVHAVRFEGASLPTPELERASRLVPGAAFEEEAVLRAVDLLRELYFGHGYPGVRVTPRLETAGDDLDVVFDVDEGTPQKVGSIEISGLGATSEAFVRRALAFHAGDPLDPRKLAAAERRLFALGIFSRVSVTHDGAESATVKVDLVEEARLVGGYQARYNDDRGLSGDLDGELRNLLGRGLAVGTRYSRGTDDEQIRGSIQLPSLGIFGNLTGSIFRNWEEKPLDETSGLTYQQLEKGLELQATRSLPDRWNLLYGYRFKTSSVTSALDNFSTKTRIASLDASVLRDTRDNALNAHRGRFWSFNLELAPRALASDLDFVKGMGQVFVSRSFGPSLTWAQGYRLGLAHVFSGEPLVFSERFTAGGGNSIRGFATDSLGPRDIFDEPAGGEAVIVVNQELRYMHRLGFGGVVFWDAGNVFAKATDLSLDLRHALGVGLRWDSPIGLLRVDLGFPLARRADEKAYRIFFSLGQAF